MESLIPAAISLLHFALPYIVGSSPGIAKAVELITAAAPSIVSTYRDLKPVVSRIITALKSDKATLPDQFKALEAAEAILDSDFEDAANKALSDDDAG